MLDEKAPNRIAAVRGIFFCAPEGIRTERVVGSSDLEGLAQSNHVFPPRCLRDRTH